MARSRDTGPQSSTALFSESLKESFLSQPVCLREVIPLTAVSILLSTVWCAVPFLSLAQYSVLSDESNNGDRLLVPHLIWVGFAVLLVNKLIFDFPDMTFATNKECHRPMRVCMLCGSFSSLVVYFLLSDFLITSLTGEEEVVASNQSDTNGTARKRTWQQPWPDMLWIYPVCQLTYQWTETLLAQCSVSCRAHYKALGHTLPMRLCFYIFTAVMLCTVHFTIIGFVFTCRYSARLSVEMELLLTAIVYPILKCGMRAVAVQGMKVSATAYGNVGDVASSSPSADNISSPLDSECINNYGIADIELKKEMENAVVLTLYLELAFTTPGQVMIALLQSWESYFLALLSNSVLEWLADHAILHLLVAHDIHGKRRKLSVALAILKKNSGSMETKVASAQGSSEDASHQRRQRQDALSIQGARLSTEDFAEKNIAILAPLAGCIVKFVLENLPEVDIVSSKVVNEDAAPESTLLPSWEALAARIAIGLLFEMCTDGWKRALFSWQYGVVLPSMRNLLKDVHVRLWTIRYGIVVTSAITFCCIGSMLVRELES